MAKTILVVDDDADIREVIHVYLRNEGYHVIEAEDGIQALEYLQKENVDLMILDLMMPRLDGVQTCLKIRLASNIPIIMLTAKGEDQDKITGLSAGADDYITKPFNPLELVARVKAQLRRQQLNTKQEEESSAVIRLEGLEIDRSRHLVTVRGREVSLTPTEFSILELLASHRGHVFGTDQIYEGVWKDPALYYSENMVMAHIRKIREKIEENPKTPRYIKTVCSPLSDSFDEAG